MKILLTGATGNLGGHVLPLLLERGHDVRCLVFDSKNERKIVNDWKRKPEVVWGDIQDERAVESALSGVEAVIHLAAIIPPMTDQNSATGSQNPPLLLKARGEHAGIDRCSLDQDFETTGC